jgi:ATP-binding cassette subfamily B protein
MGLYFRGKNYDANHKTHMLDSKTLAVLWTFAKPFRGLLLAALVVMLLGTAADLVRPYLLKIAIDRQVVFHDLAGLKVTAQLYAWTIALSAILTYVQTVFLQYIGQKIIYQLRQRVFRYLIYQQYVDMEAQPVGRMVTRVTNDTDAIKDLYTDVLVSFAGDCLVLGGIIVVMLCIDWQLALVSFTVIPVMFIFSSVYQKYARQAYRLVREKTANVNTFLQESMNGISVIKAFARFRRSEVEFADVSVSYLKAGIKEMRTFAIFRPLVDLIYMLAVVLVLWYGGWQNRYSGMEIGVIVAFLSYVEKLFMPIKDLAEKYNLLQSALAAAERVYDMLVSEQPVEEKLVANSGEYFFGNIIFENIWFAYEEPYWVLQDVSFEIKAGEFVGVVGLSGSGKSTIISLLLRFYEPQRGRILLDGVDISNIPLAVLRRTVGVVFQDVHLFKGSIAENISMYDLSMSQETIVAAAETANAHEFIMKLPERYDGHVGYQGALLSVGQRQLVSLARALACEAVVLVLDEATSSIDSETERLIQGALENIVAERTMLVVAHRLSTIQHADNIVVLHQGRVVEQGTHLELLTYQNIYYQLHNSQ